MANYTGSGTSRPITNSAHNNLGPLQTRPIANSAHGHTKVPFVAFTKDFLVFFQDFRMNLVWARQFGLSLLLYYYHVNYT